MSTPTEERNRSEREEVPPWVPSSQVGPSLQREITRILKQAAIVEVTEDTP